jgi:hypothetical protein
MSLLGTAALAMWWRITEDVVEEFEDWHSHEHFAERLAIPGFRRASRWRSRERRGGFFVMYELDDHAVLSSPAYLQRLNAPTPWSTKMMPHHQGMIRSQCRVVESRGSTVAAHATTVRLSPVATDGTALRHHLGGIVSGVVARQGLAGAHLLHHERPAIAQTTEQKIRGGDREADWVLVLVGYGADAMADVARRELGPDALAAAGAAPAAEVEHYALSHSAVPPDVAA